jgi:membrane-associated phospholipid phosphatase
MRRLLRFFSILACLAALAPTVRADDVEEISCEGPLVGDNTRYPNMRVLPRFARDFVSLPGSVVAWDSADWARFGAFTMPTGALMWPIEPSLDVRVNKWLRAHETPKADKFFVKIGTLPESFFLAGYGAVLFSTAWLTKNDRLFEYATLALETIGQVQFWQVATKLMIGRQSPYQVKGDGEPGIYGPTRMYFPGGTPSGHAITAWSMLFVLADYYGHWPLYAFATLGGIYVSASLVYERQHYLSDVVIGAGMGIYIARFIVKHRSSRYRCRAKKQRASWGERLTVMPVAMPGQAYGLVFSLQL